jgi:cell wall-associated NlpC family hydrolase
MSQRVVLIVAVILAIVGAIIYLRHKAPPDTSPHFQSDTVSLALRRAVYEMQSPRNRRVAQRYSDSAQFVSEVYENTFGILLPYSAEAQMKEGTAVKPQDMVSGDLMFFEDGDDVDVGFYIDGAQFGHYAPLTGARIERLDNAAWSGRYLWSRRVLQ